MGADEFLCVGGGFLQFPASFAFKRLFMQARHG